MSQQYPQQPHAQFQPQLPPTKKHTVRNVLLILLVLSVVGIGGCMAVINSVGTQVSKSIDENEKQTAPRDVKPGTAFTIGKHQTLAGWKVTNAAGMFSVVGKVKNVSDATSTSFIHFKFLTAGGEVLGNVQCNSSDLEPGQTETLNCVPDGKFGKYTKVTAEGTF